ncbi:MAG: sigma 54-interacting transcriptional regulator [Alphaproteobacteria bacterium]
MTRDAIAVWLQADTDVPPGFVRSLVDLLHGEGFVVADGDDPGPAMRLLLVGQIAAADPERVRALSQDATQRLCVIAVDDPAVPAKLIWDLLASGASDFIVADMVAGAPAAVVRPLAARLRHWAEIDRIVESGLVRDNLVGRSPAWQRCLQRLVEAARFGDGPILLIGDSGTGKELAARLVHTLDRARAGGELIIVDCGALDGNLCGSELFGHERGAFTGAVGARRGALALANGGTLFLDEIGELPLELQPKLLRAIQEKQYKQVGGNPWQKTDFRPIAATNRNLDDAVAAGGFRADLYYRLAGTVIRLPSLAERRSDIPLIAAHFLRALCPDGTPALDPLVCDFLVGRDYPGNVRDLRQLIQRIAPRHVGAGPITLSDVPEEDRPQSGPVWPDDGFRAALDAAVARRVGLREVTRVAGDLLVSVALDQSAGDLGRAATLLGVTRRALEQRRAHHRMGAARSA